MHYQPLEFGFYVKLAAQAAIGLSGRGSGLEHRILVLCHRGQHGLELFFDVDVAGGALAVAAAFGHDAVDAVLHGAFHDGVANRNLNCARGAGM